MNEPIKKMTTAMPIRKAMPHVVQPEQLETADIKYTRLVILGDTGVGKTRMSVTMPKPVIIECDTGGTESVPEIASERIFDVSVAYNPVEAIENVIRQLREKENEENPFCQTLIVDGFGELTRNIIDWSMETQYAAKAKLSAPRISPTYDDYEIVANTVRRIARKLATLKAHKVFTAHVKVNQETGQDEPDITGQSRARIIQSMASFSCLMRKDTSGTVVWNFSAGNNLLTKTRAMLEGNQQRQKVTPANFAAFFTVILKSRGWTPEAIAEEMTRQYGSVEEYERILKLKYSDIIK